MLSRLSPYWLWLLLAIPASASSAMCSPQQTPKRSNTLCTHQASSPRAL